MKPAKNHKAVYANLLAIVGALAASAAIAQESIIEHSARVHTPPDEYYFFEDDRKKVIDYKSERIVRICVGEHRHLVPLKVTYDGATTELGTGDCIRVEAKEVYLEPTERLKSNIVIEADVETVS